MSRFRNKGEQMQNFVFYTGMHNYCLFKVTWLYCMCENVSFTHQYQIIQINTF